MPMSRGSIVTLTVIAFEFVLSGCGQERSEADESTGRSAGGPPVPVLPDPGPVVFRFPIVVGWGADEAPVAPPGFVVERFAAGLSNPRWLYTLPNGDVLVAQARTETIGGLEPQDVARLKEYGLIGGSPNSIMLLRRTGSTVERHSFIEGLNQPFGMLLHGDYLYVANTDSLVRFPYQDGTTRITTAPEQVIAIPAGEKINPWNNHWTRNIVANPDGSQLFLSVGSGTNINAEGVDPPDRAAIWVLNTDGSGKRLFATGLRNPVGLAFDPVTGNLWTTVNERDGLGEEHPPDYLTHVVDGAYYGWPYVYFGSYPDPTHQKLNPQRVQQAQRTARVPDLALGGHSVPLGLLFYRGTSFPEKYRHGAFVARRGGVSRARFIGVDVVFVPFVDGSPTGEIEPFLTGFVKDYDDGTVHGRPVGLATLTDGSLLVTDDAANVIWRVAYRP